MSHDLERPGPDDDLIIRGEIETTSVPELLRSLLGSGETGVLTIRNGEAIKSIFILSGRVVYASSNNPDERLGEVLLVRGKITVRNSSRPASASGPACAWARSWWSWARWSRKS